MLGHHYMRVCHIISLRAYHIIRH
uniref:Uncharacterized protein n=1 Tax=Arundo donax TaxID=35708 RepID=A0A0A9DM28_ARUDO